MDLALGARIVEQRDVGVGVDVDEARCDDAIRGVDDLAGAEIGEPAERLDAAVPNADVGPVARRAGPVDDDSAQDQDLEFDGRVLPRGLYRDGRQPTEPA